MGAHRAVAYLSLWLSSSWPQLSTYRLHLGPWLGHLSAYLVGWESYHPPIPEIPSCGVLFPRQIGQGPHLGQPILPCLTVRAWRPPPLLDKGFGSRARSVSSPLSAALGFGPFFCLPSGSVSSRDPLFDLQVLPCRVQARRLMAQLASGGCPPSRLGSGSS